MTPDELTKVRQDLHLSQAELARKLRVAANTVNRWEAGVRKIPPYLWLAIEGLHHQQCKARRSREGGGRSRARWATTSNQ